MPRNRERKTCLVSLGGYGLYLVFLQREEFGVRGSWAAVSLALALVDDDEYWEKVPCLLERSQGWGLVFTEGVSWRFWRWLERRFDLFGNERR